MNVLVVYVELAQIWDRGSRQQAISLIADSALQLKTAEICPVASPKYLHGAITLN